MIQVFRLPDGRSYDMIFLTSFTKPFTGGDPAARGAPPQTSDRYLRTCLSEHLEPIRCVELSAFDRAVIRRGILAKQKFQRNLVRKKYDEFEIVASGSSVYLMYIDQENDMLIIEKP